MATQPQPTAGRQIRTLLFVLGFGVVLAFGLAAFMLYVYGPSGSYVLKDVLLAPELVQELSYMDRNARTGKDSRFVFDSMDFSYKVIETREWRRTAVSLSRYADFYKLLSDDKSEVDVPEQIVALFMQSPPASLVLSVKTVGDDRMTTDSKIFQEVQISAQGDMYRVELRNQNMSLGSWAYFRRSQIYSLAQKLLEEQ